MRTDRADAQTKADHACDQVVEWLEHFEELADPRQSGKVAYRLDEMLLQCLSAVLAGADSWVEIAEFGRKKLDVLRRFAAFEHGTPPMINSAICLPRSTPKPSSDAASPGSHR